MPKLRHVSLHTADPEKTAEFYKRVFDMVEVGRTDSGRYFVPGIRIDLLGKSGVSSERRLCPLRANPTDHLSL